jgi:hypothetical protein
LGLTIGPIQKLPGGGKLKIINPKS